MRNVEQRLKDIIVNQLFIEDSEIAPDADIRDDLGADSIDCVELIMTVEKEFSISIPDDEAENIRTLQQAVEYINRFPDLE